MSCSRSSLGNWDLKPDSLAPKPMSLTITLQGCEITLFDYVSITCLLPPVYYLHENRGLVCLIYPWIFSVQMHSRHIKILTKRMVLSICCALFPMIFPMIDSLSHCTFLLFDLAHSLQQFVFLTPFLNKRIASISPASLHILHVVILVESTLEIINFKLFSLHIRIIKLKETKQDTDQNPFTFPFLFLLFGIYT